MQRQAVGEFQEPPFVYRLRAEGRAEGRVEGRVPLSELPKHAGDLATPAGILIDKGELLSGNPTEITRSGVADINVEVESLGIKIVLPEVVVPQEKALGEGAGKDLPVIETRPVEERA